MNGDQLGLNASDWGSLIEAVRKKKCTPCIGAGTGRRLFGSPKDVARWGLARDTLGNDTDLDLLSPDADNLPRIAHQLGSRHGAAIPKGRMADYLTRRITSNLECTPHVALASLKFKIWITTAYDDLIERALTSQGKGDPQVRLCKWSSSFSDQNNNIEVPNTNHGRTKLERPFAEIRGESLSETQPLVYHFYGHFGWEETLVISEFDHFEFLTETARHTNVQQAPSKRAKSDVSGIQSCVTAAISSTSLLFVGYRLGDLDLRVLLHSIRQHLTMNKLPNFVLQLQPEDPASEELKQALQGPGEAGIVQTEPSAELEGRLRQYAQDDFKRYFGQDARIKVLFATSGQLATVLADNVPQG